MEVWNKIDLLNPDRHASARIRAERDPGLYAVSAITGEGLEDLLAAISRQLEEVRHETTLHLSFSDGRRRAWLFEQDVVQSEEQTEAGFEIKVLWTSRQEARFGAL